MLTIHTYGHIDAMFYTLNSIAMIMNNSAIDGLIKFFAVISIAYGCIQIGVEAPSGKPYRRHITRLFLIIILINLALVPKLPMKLYDHVSKEQDVVDNLPLGFALPVGIIESVGAGITDLFEQAFSGVTKFNYMEYGSNFGSSLIAESRNWMIQDPDFQLNMDQFLERCVIMPASWGSPLTLDELFHSDNIWGDLLKNKLKNGIRKVVLNDKGIQRSFTCKGGYEFLNDKFKYDSNKLAKTLSRTIYGIAGRTNYTNRQELRSSNIERNVKKVFSEYLDNKNSAGDVMRQVMLMNQFSKYGDYGTLRAIQNQETTWQIAGKVAGYYLPVLLTIAKSLLYACFIFLVPACILTGNISQFKGFLVIVASFQLWPSLYAILNMFTDLYTADQVSELAHGAVSYATFSKVGYVADKIVAISSGLQMSVPFIALGIAQGSMTSLVHMASNLSGTVTSSASNAANEINSGNRNFDNVSMRNISANKVDTNTSYKKGASEMQMADNSLIKTSNLGESYSVSGAGISSMVSGYKFDMNSRMESQLSNSINDQMSVANNSQAGYSNAKSDAINKGINIIKDLSKNQGLIDSYAKESGSDDIKSLSSVVSTFNNLVKDQGYNETNAFHAAVGLSVPKISIGGSYSRSNTRSTHYGKQEGAGSQEATTRGLNLIEKALNSKNFTEATNVNRSLSDSFQNSISEMSNYHRSETQALDKLHSLQSAQSQIRSSGTSQARDITGEVTEMTARQMNISNNDARILLESGNRNAREIANQAADNIAAKTISEEYKVSIPGIAEFHQGGKEALSRADQKYQFNHRNAARNNENQQESEILRSNLRNGDIDLQKGMQIKEEINNKNQSRAQNIDQTYEDVLSKRDNLRKKVKDKNNKWTFNPDLRRDDDFEDK